MRLTPPAQATWLIALVLGLLGVLIRTGALHVGLDAFWLIVVAWVLLLIAPLVKGI